MNRRNLTKLIAYLKDTRPADFNMGSWCRCIAGHASRLAVGLEASAGFEADIAERWLGLDHQTANELFTGGPSLLQATLDRAIVVLEHLLATGKVDWTCDEPKPLPFWHHWVTAVEIATRPRVVGPATGPAVEGRVPELVEID